MTHLAPATAPCPLSADEREQLVRLVDLGDIPAARGQQLKVRLALRVAADLEGFAWTWQEAGARLGVDARSARRWFGELELLGFIAVLDARNQRGAIVQAVTLNYAAIAARQLEDGVVTRFSKRPEPHHGSSPAQLMLEFPAGPNAPARAATRDAEARDIGYAAHGVRAEDSDHGQPDQPAAATLELKCGHQRPRAGLVAGTSAAPAPAPAPAPGAVGNLSPADDCAGVRPLSPVTSFPKNPGFVMGDKIAIEERAGAGARWVPIKGSPLNPELKTRVPIDRPLAQVAQGRRGDAPSGVGSGGTRGGPCGLAGEHAPGFARVAPRRSPQADAAGDGRKSVARRRLHRTQPDVEGTERRWDRTWTATQLRTRTNLSSEAAQNLARDVFGAHPSPRPTSLILLDMLGPGADTEALVPLFTRARVVSVLQWMIGKLEQDSEARIVNFAKLARVALCKRSRPEHFRSDSEAIAAMRRLTALRAQSA